MRSLATAVAAALVSLLLVAPSASGASYRSCDRVVNPYAGTRYEGSDLTRIRVLRASCATARRVARGAHRKALGLTPTEDGTREFRWNGWKVTGDLRGAEDTYRASKGSRRVRWRF